MRPLALLAAGLCAGMLAGCANSPAPNKYQQLASSPGTLLAEAADWAHGVRPFPMKRPARDCPVIGPFVSCR